MTAKGQLLQPWDYCINSESWLEEFVYDCEMNSSLFLEEDPKNIPRAYVEATSRQKNSRYVLLVGVYGLGFATLTVATSVPSSCPISNMGFNNAALSIDLEAVVWSRVLLNYGLDSLVTWLMILFAGTGILGWARDASDIVSDLQL